MTPSSLFNQSQWGCITSPERTLETLANKMWRKQQFQQNWPGLTKPCPKRWTQMVNKWTTTTIQRKLTVKSSKDKVPHIKSKPNGGLCHQQSFDLSIPSTELTGANRPVKMFQTFWQLWLKMAMTLWTLNTFSIINAKLSVAVTQASPYKSSLGYF